MGSTLPRLSLQLTPDKCASESVGGKSHEAAILLPVHQRKSYDCLKTKGTSVQKHYDAMQREILTIPLRLIGGSIKKKTLLILLSHFCPFCSLHFSKAFTLWLFASGFIEKYRP